MRGSLVALIAAALVSAGAAWATEHELKWDTGTWHISITSGQGDDFWFGNDFDTSTIGTGLRVNRMRIYSWWGHNGRWDGFRIALFAFDAAPGSIIWPASGVPKFVKPSGSEQMRWCDFGVNWTLAAATDKFLAGQEQFYNYPNCDSYCFDDETVNKGHTWRKSQGWSKYPFYNLMLRVFVEGATAVAPASLGRVKALYY